MTSQVTRVLMNQMNEYQEFKQGLRVETHAELFERYPLASARRKRIKPLVEVRQAFAWYRIAFGLLILATWILDWVNWTEVAAL